VKDILLIFESRRINRLNAIMFTALNLSLMAGNFLLGQMSFPLFLALASTLAIAWVVLLLPFAQIVKCLVIPLLPCLATFALAWTGGGRSWFSLTVFGSFVMGALYFKPFIIVFDFAFVNLLFAASLAAGGSLVGPGAGFNDNLNHLFRMDLLAAILFFGTKWGSDAAQAALRLSERSEAADRDLRELNATLEAKVEERTRELEQLVADLRAAQEQLIDAEKQASLGNLVAGVAHEVNTPLGVCITAVTRMKGDNTAFHRAIAENRLTREGLADHVNATTESLDILSFNLFRAAEIIKSFKEIAVNQSSEVMATFCLDDYIRTILTSLKHELKNRKTEIAINFERFSVNSYPGAFSHVITNFIMNTLVHGYDQWERVRIEFDARREDGHLVFTYTDHGKGIPPEIIKRIFDPFFTTRRGAGGSGLGLFIVYNVVKDKLGGSISCDSVLGEYTTFTIRI
jgi:signal transduction histidine kinase